jgi:DNA polymerase-1
VSLEEAEETLELWYAGLYTTSRSSAYGADRISDRPEVREYQEFTIAKALRSRFTRTLMGRFRPVRCDLSNKWDVARASRVAINTPVQGGAADVVIMAMLKIHRHERLRELNWKLILQVISWEWLDIRKQFAPVRERLSVIFVGNHTSDDRRIVLLTPP